MFVEKSNSRNLDFQTCEEDISRKGAKNKKRGDAKGTQRRESRRIP